MGTFSRLALALLVCAVAITLAPFDESHDVTSGALFARAEEGTAAHSSGRKYDLRHRRVLRPRFNPENEEEEDLLDVLNISPETLATLADEEDLDLENMDDEEMSLFLGVLGMVGKAKKALIGGGGAGKLLGKAKGLLGGKAGAVLGKASGIMGGVMSNPVGMLGKGFGLLKRKIGQRRKRRRGKGGRRGRRGRKKFGRKYKKFSKKRGKRVRIPFGKPIHHFHFHHGLLPPTPVNPKTSSRLYTLIKDTVRSVVIEALGPNYGKFGSPEFLSGIQNKVIDRAADGILNQWKSEESNQAIVLGLQKQMAERLSDKLQETLQQNLPSALANEIGPKISRTLHPALKAQLPDKIANAISNDARGVIAEEVAKKLSGSFLASLSGHVASRIVTKIGSRLFPLVDQVLSYLLSKRLQIPPFHLPPLPPPPTFDHYDDDGDADDYDVAHHLVHFVTGSDGATDGLDYNVLLNVLKDKSRRNLRGRRRR